MNRLEHAELNDLVQSNLHVVGQLGWACFPTPSQICMADFMMLVACSLGKPRGMRQASQVMDEVVVTGQSAALPSSLSSIYGKGKFPLHTDTAHWTTPCRYLVLGCQNSGRANRRTTLLDWSSIDLPARMETLLSRAVFRIRNGAASFYATITSPCTDFVRFDLGCMSPASSSAEDVMGALLPELEKLEPQTICWKKNDVLVIDNWAVLHGREDVVEADDDRKLLRILVQ